MRAQTLIRGWMKRRSRAGLIVVVLFWAIPGIGLTQEEELAGGKLEYETHCAVCHGLKGKGDGGVAQYLTVKPADLTQISKKSGGKFPFWRVYRTIDGRDPVKAHGTKEMPIWGDRFLKEASDVEHKVTGRIFELVHYLESMQEK